ncbi:nucleolar protein 4 isoform X3 [Numenius arquata]|uniref:Nucleolar protein 4 n=3 Tax=Neoaves TaxID=3078114 RepID=A0A8C0BSH2_9AVES|nr:PREDICTED: nucleolar protein 4 isoform X2 [Aptenodytes forsteri]XP_009329700.1 PREDICTED: nucleolar protein 4 isoform X2 [Pygoscelis adeliae]XP_010572671.1 PREDICTED: nucleolar protein 4 isoform X2 [Haliaeetus leucocephalus]
MESGDRDMYRQFQDWCLRTYGDSGKTKTVTRKKYDRIVQLLNGSESSSTDNAKFKFWVKSKGFQLGNSDEVSGGAGGGKQVLYVPVKTTDGVGVDEKLSLRRVAVVEDFFDIIYSMHVETGPNGEQIRKHAGQKRTYKAISETYAFLPREAVTRFLMSCSECQKRMHLNPDGADHKDNGKPPTLVTSMIDYNMPITMAYMKHMKLQLLNSQQDEDESSIESDEFDMSDSTRMSAVNSDLSSNLEERMQSPQNLQGQQDDDSAAESFNGNETVGHSSNASGGTHCREMAETNSNGKTNLEQDEQPLNLSDSPLSAQLTSEYRLDDHSSNGKNKYKTLLISDLKMEREARENGSKSPAHSYSSYDSGKNESVGRGAEDLSLNRGDEDEDDHDEQEDPEKVNESDGVEAERLKAFNSRPIPSHLTSAVAESILASACESESRNAAKRMRLDRQQDEAAPADKQYKQEPAQVTYSTSAVSSTQEVLYINGNGTYSYHSYRGLGGGLLNLNDASSSGPTDLSMKRQLATSSGSSSSSSSRPQLSPTEINAVRQLVAGYRESAAFLLRSADELENLILQQN